MSDLVGNPEDRFSRVEAHVILMMGKSSKVKHSSALYSVMGVSQYLVIKQTYNVTYNCIYVSAYGSSVRPVNQATSRSGLVSSIREGVDKSLQSHGLSHEKRNVQYMTYMCCNMSNSRVVCSGMNKFENLALL